MAEQSELNATEISERMEMLLLSSDPSSVLLGLELAMNPAIAEGQLTLILALYLLHRSEKVRDMGGRAFARLAGADLRTYVGQNWESTHLKGNPDVYYNALRKLGEHPELEGERFLKLAVRLRRRAPETVAEHFPKVFLEWAKIYLVHGEFLPLSGYRFPYLPASLSEIKGLKSLEANNCGLRRIPEAVVQLDELLTLDVSDNLLRELPDFLADMPALVQLKWEGNLIQQFPDVIARMKGIQSLDLDLRSLRDLRGLEKCQQVEWIKVKYGRRSDLPAELLELRNLHGLTMRKAGLKQLPDGMVRLKKLEDLDLEENNFAEMPPVLGQMASLQFLTLGKVESAESLPSLARLEKLSRLTMSPRFRAWPAGWCQLPRLRTLRLKDGLLEELPIAFSQLIELHSLDLSNNRLEIFPSVLQHLELMDLNLHGNNISEIPPEIVEMKKLTVLDLSHNPLTRLPDEIYQMKRLVRLELQNTQLPLEQIKRFARDLPHTKVRFS